ncbi:hypothetical protein, partial [Parabacteroides distasonis]|uniref:hypothetical protein n=1 Tax=Parabacteroides distasonis TaxID=823 RepID=UPI00321AC3D5
YSIRLFRISETKSALVCSAISLTSNHKFEIGFIFLTLAPAGIRLFPLGLLLSAIPGLSFFRKAF